MLTHRIYYQVKPFIPRSLQIFLRRRIALQKRKLYTHVWPIDEKANKRPQGWSGWPGKKQFALVITHDVEGSKGVQSCSRLAKLDESYGFRSSFNFVAEDCEVSAELLNYLTSHGFEIGVHGLHHDGNLFRSKRIFRKQAVRINCYMKKWDSVGFRTPCMYHNLDWIHDLNIEYDSSTFDTDPFEPQPDGMATIFPFWVPRNPSRSGLDLDPLSFNLSPSSSNLQSPHSLNSPEPVTRNPQLVTGLHGGFVELPYTLPQDFTLFIVMKEKDIDIWKEKLDWIAGKGGMALLVTHPDYMNFDEKKLGIAEYRARNYEGFLEYIKSKYEGQYWHVLPKEMARYWSKNIYENCPNKNPQPK